MSEISEASLEACRHMGWYQEGEYPDRWYKDYIPSFHRTNELPRPDEDHGDCMRYLLFVIDKGFTVWEIGSDYCTLRNNSSRRMYGTPEDGEALLAAITAACNAAMRAVTKESEARS